MKKYFLILSFALLTLVGSAQVSNLFKPIDNVLLVSNNRSLVNNRGILDNVAMRLNVGVTTTQSTYVNTEDKLFDSHPMAAVGFGFGLQHYVARPNGELFNDYGANLLLLVPTGVEGSKGMGVGLFGNVDKFQLGVDYNFTLKKVSLDTGITLKF
jgi:hypothetical protein